MANEVTIRAHTRKSKKGKTVSVHSYSRRIGRKGIKSPKRSKESGDEYKEIMENKTNPTEEKVTFGPYGNAEELRLRNERLLHGKSAVDSIRMYKENKDNLYPKRRQLVNTAPQPVMQGNRRKGFMDRVEEKVASFLTKYSGRKYKKYF